MESFADSRQRRSTHQTRSRSTTTAARAPLEQFTDEQLAAAMQAADAIEQSRRLQQLIAEQERHRLHPLAFRLARGRLRRQGATEAKMFFGALERTP